MIRFIHTADWQIGKVFRRFGDREALFREARLAGIEAIGRLALAEGVRHVLVAGDAYDTETPSRTTLLAPLERMRRFSGVTWHLIPGNHDPHRPKGLWDTLLAEGLPANVRPHLAPVPHELEPGCFLLPAPLTRKSEPNDLTLWMDGAGTPPGSVRIGLAHGSVAGFSSEGEAGNPIDPARPIRAGLSYLALGDWHRTLSIGERCWYAGTHEPDRSGGQEQGKALLVEAPGATAAPRVAEVPVGTYRWLTRSVSLRGEEGLGDLEVLLHAVDDASRVVLCLEVEGHVSVRGRTRLDGILERLEAAVCCLDADLSGLRTTPSPEDLEAIDFDGVLRRVAGSLQERLADPALPPFDRRVAEDALIRLHLLAGEAAR